MKSKMKSSDKKVVILQKYTWRVAGMSAIGVLSSNHHNDSELSLVCG